MQAKEPIPPRERFQRIVTLAIEVISVGVILLMIYYLATVMFKAPHNLR